jgi:hypothetical protein
LERIQKRREECVAFIFRRLSLQAQKG